MSQSADAATRASAPTTLAQPAVDLPDRMLFWRWVWSAVRPVVGWVLAAAGTITLIVGWFGVSGESLTAKQLPYLVSAGLAGIALFIMAGVFLATDDVRRQFERITELERKVDDLYALFVADIAAAPAATAAAASTAAASTPRTAAPDVVALPAGSSYHRSDCSLVAGKHDATTVTPSQIASRNLRPCRVCDPGPAPTG